MNFIKINILILILILSIKIEIHGQSDKGDEFVKDLISKMTIDEKIGQMTLFTSDWDVTGPVIRKNYQEDIKSGKVGAIFNAHTSAYTRKLQKIAVEETRLGIPLLFGYDVIHGYKTIFPISLGESCSWDLESIEKSARISAEEATSAGLHWTFAPMVDISRDPRWGRVSEGAGEDPFLGSEIAKARVKGFQGNSLNNTNTMIACAKHFAAYGAAQAGRDYNTVEIPERTLREIYLPPFKAALDVGVKTFMTAFNDLNGIPATSNSYLLNEILKKEWHFDGFVVSDYTSINELVNHATAENEKDAGYQSFQAGVDMDMQGAVFYKYLKELYLEGKVKMVDIDKSVYRILKIKYDLGLFSNPYKYSNEAREKSQLLNKKNRSFARDIARKSMVLLENKTNILPFRKTIKSIAVVGELANSQQDMLGSWHAAGQKEDCITLLQGIKNKVGKNTEIIYKKGCGVLDKTISDKSIEETLNDIQNVEVVVLAIGEKAWMSGEAASRSDISIPEAQLKLAKAIIKTEKPVAVVLMNGRPLTIPWLAKFAPALLESWYSGTEGGNAIADIIFGDYNPSGKLTVTFPRNVGQIPIFYNTKRTGRPLDNNDKYTTKYLDCKNTAQYVFGYGLSYSNFEYSKPITSSSVLSFRDSLTIQCNIQNTGKYDGEEVVQLYIKDDFSSSTRPVKELKGFKKIFIKSGESSIVSFTIKDNDLAYLDKEMNFKAEPGSFHIYIGTDSNTSNSVEIKLIK